MMKKNFVFPNIDDALARVQSAHKKVQAGLESEDAYDPTEDGSFCILAMEQGSSLAPHVDSVREGWKRYVKLHKNAAAIGLFGLEAKLKGRILCTSAITRNALQLDHDVLSAVTPWLPTSTVPGDKLSTVPAPYLCSPQPPIEGSPQWKCFASAGKTLETVAFVALTPVCIKVVPHGQDQREVWRGLTCDGGSDPRSYPADNLLSPKMCDAMEAAAYYRAELDPGDVLLTHVGMPYCIEQSPRATAADDVYVVKTVIFEKQSKGNKKGSTWKSLLSTGNWTLTSFDDKFNSKMFPTQSTEMDKSDWLFQPASPHQVPWLTGVTGKQSESTSPSVSTPTSPKEKNKEADDEKKSDNQDDEKESDNEEKDEDEKKEKKKEKKEKKDKKEKKNDQKEKKNDEKKEKKENKKDEGKTKKDNNEKTSPKHKPTTKSRSFAQVVEQYESLKKRIAAMDQRAWKPSHCEAADKRAAETTATSDGRDLTTYGKVLDTLAKRVSEAEKKSVDVLPTVLANLAELGELLGGIKHWTKDTLNKECNSRDARQKLYDIWKTQTHDLVHEEKKIAESVEVIKSVCESGAKRLEKPKKRARGVPGVAQNGDDPLAGLAPLASSMDVPEVDEGSLKPFIVEGVKECLERMKVLHSTYERCKVIAEASTNESLKTRTNSLFEISVGEISPQYKAIKAAGIGSIDFAKATAYAEVFC